jgi:hypothetical protein
MLLLSQASSSKASSITGRTWRFDRFTGQVIDKQIEVDNE